MLVKAFGSNSISLLYATIWTGNAEIDSGDLELWSGGSIDVNSSQIFSGPSNNGTSGDVALYAQGSNTITLLSAFIHTSPAGSDSGAVELWSGGSIDMNSCQIYSSASANGTSGHLTAYALGRGFNCYAGILGTGWANGDSGGDSGSFEILAAGPVTFGSSILSTGNSVSGDSGDFTSTSVNAHTTFGPVFLMLWTGDASAGNSGSILIHDFAPRPEGGVIEVNSSYVLHW
ncbi:MAG: hypothetical protein JW878_09680 [Methanomicrobia archaeon]|nr:hypothetical protein [Methanomicrobia archaeon]